VLVLGVLIARHLLEKPAWQDTLFDTGAPDSPEPSTAAILRPAGFEVETVHGGRAALDQLEAGRYDLVICDLVMPDVDGVAVYRAIQERGEPRPLMLFLSGYHDAGGYETFLREARVPTAPKPFDVDDLRRTVKRLLGEV